MKNEIKTLLIHLVLDSVLLVSLLAACYVLMLGVLAFASV